MNKKHLGQIILASGGSLGLLATSISMGLTGATNNSNTMIKFDNRWFDSYETAARYYIAKNYDSYQKLQVLGDLQRATIDANYFQVNKNQLFEYDPTKISPAYVAANGDLINSYGLATNSQANRGLAVEYYTDGITNKIFTNRYDAELSRNNSALVPVMSEIQLKDPQDERNVITFNPTNKDDLNYIKSRLEGRSNLTSNYVIDDLITKYLTQDSNVAPRDSGWEVRVYGKENDFSNDLFASNKFKSLIDLDVLANQKVILKDWGMFDQTNPLYIGKGISNIDDFVYDYDKDEATFKYHLYFNNLELQRDGTINGGTTPNAPIWAWYDDDQATAFNKVDWMNDLHLGLKMVGPNVNNNNGYSFEGIYHEETVAGVRSAARHEYYHNGEDNHGVYESNNNRLSPNTINYNINGTMSLNSLIDSMGKQQIIGSGWGIDTSPFRPRINLTKNDMDKTVKWIDPHRQSRANWGPLAQFMHLDPIDEQKYTIESGLREFYNTTNIGSTIPKLNSLKDIQSKMNNVLGSNNIDFFVDVQNDKSNSRDSNYSLGTNIQIENMGVDTRNSQAAMILYGWDAGWNYWHFASLYQWKNLAATMKIAKWFNPEKVFMANEDPNTHKKDWSNINLAKIYLAKLNNLNPKTYITYNGKPIYEASCNPMGSTNKWILYNVSNHVRLENNGEYVINNYYSFVNNVYQNEVDNFITKLREVKNSFDTNEGDTKWTELKRLVDNRLLIGQLAENELINQTNRPFEYYTQYLYWLMRYLRVNMKDQKTNEDKEKIDKFVFPNEIVVWEDAAKYRDEFTYKHYLLYDSKLFNIRRIAEKDKLSMSATALVELTDTGALQRERDYHLINVSQIWVVYDQYGMPKLVENGLLNNAMYDDLEVILNNIRREHPVHISKDYVYMTENNKSTLVLNKFSFIYQIGIENKLYHFATQEGMIKFVIEHIKRNAKVVQG